MAVHPAATHAAAHPTGKVAGKMAVNHATKHTAAHPGWKTVAETMAKKKGISVEHANRILGSRAKHYTASAVAKNPNLLHIRSVANRMG